MRRWPTTSAAALFFAFAGTDAICQVGAYGDTSTQVRKQWELGQRIANDLETTDGSINDPAILGYLQQLAGRLATTARAPPMRVRLTRSTDEYASLLPNHDLYLSAGLLARIEDEAELAGLIAHELGHLPQGQQGSPFRGPCVLASLLAPSWPGDLREREQQASAAAVSYLKAAVYDPAGVLDLLSKLAYAHPVWAKVIASEDLIDLRVRLERETIPQTGYRLDSFGFSQVHNTLEGMLGKVIDRATLAARPVLVPRR
jgi:hypothetical protein